MKHLKEADFALVIDPYGVVKPIKDRGTPPAYIATKLRQYADEIDPRKSSIKTGMETQIELEKRSIEDDRIAQIARLEARKEIAEALNGLRIVGDQIWDGS